jgi:hypothetical protein
MATASPRAFYHDHGTWDDEKKQLVVDLRGKILVFLDQPHYMLMEALREYRRFERGAVTKLQETLEEKILITYR